MCRTSTRTGSVALGVVLALVAGGAHAQCTASADAKAAKRSLSRAISCNDRALRSGPGTCTSLPPPACAGTLVGDATALGYGPNDPAATGVDRPAVALQLACQKAIGKGIKSYVGAKLVGLVAGKDPVELEARARRRLDKMVERCAVTVAQDVSGVVVPAVGPQCAAAVGPAGNVVDAPALRDCLLDLLGVWVDRFGPNPQPLRPNILFILTDDQRWDTTDGTHSPSGAFVMPRTRAELAAQGIELTNAYMTTPLCCPSRTSILSGQFSHRTGVYKNGGNNGGADDFDDTSTLATWLESAGYRTSLIGKYLNGYQQLWNQSQHVPPGWTLWNGMTRVSFFDWKIIEPDGLGGYQETTGGSAPEDYLTDVLRERAKSFITDAVTAGQPFFLYLAFKAPHLPQIPAPRHEGTLQHIPPWRPPSFNEADVSDKPSWVQALPLQNVAQIDQIRIDQLEMLQAVDEAIGGNPAYGIVGIMEHLRALGVADDTIVIFMSDNGWLWGEHRLRAKNQPYEESIRMPMMVRYPKLVPLPRTDDRFALNIDIAPTLAELAGVAVPIFEDGASLVRVLDGTAPTWRTDFLAEAWPGSHPWAVVHEGQWKYTEIPVVPGDPMTAFETELYDLIADPFELQNVASAPENAARVAMMAARLRVLRQNWPVDSDPNGPDPDEDE